MLPRAKEQPPDPPDAPGGAGAAAPGAAGAPAAASASAQARLPQGSLPNAPVSGASARLHADREESHASAADDSAGPGGSALGPGPELGSGTGPANGASASAERPGGALAAGPGSGPGSGSASGAPAPAEESFRRIQLEATAPGAGLVGEERGLFYGGALTRAKRDTGGVGVSQSPSHLVAWPQAPLAAGFRACRPATAVSLKTTSHEGLWVVGRARSGRTLPPVNCSSR